MENVKIGERGQCFNKRRFVVLLILFIIIALMYVGAPALDADADADAKSDASSEAAIDSNTSQDAASNADTEISINILVPPIWDFDSVGEFNNGFAKVEKDEKYGVIDKTGKIIVPLEYDEVGDFQNGYAAVGRGDYTNKKYGFVDLNGNVVIPLIYDYVRHYKREGIVWVSKDRKEGFVDMAGNIIVPIEYDDAAFFYYPFSNNIIKTEKEIIDDEGKEHTYASLFDCKGNIILPAYPTYIPYVNETEGTAIAYQYNRGEKIFIVDKSGEVFALPDYDDINDFSNGLTRVEKDGKYGFIDKTGKVIVPLEYDYADEFDQGRAIVGIDIGGVENYGLINKSGNIIIPLEYSYININRDDAIVDVIKNGKCGLISLLTGEIILPLKYNYLGNFSEGLASYEPYRSDGSKSGKYGYIDTTGAVVIRPEYDAAYSFLNGLARVQKDGKYGLVDKTGKVIVPIEYDKIERISDEFGNKLAKVGKGSKYGLVDKTGKVVVPIEYGYIEPISEELAIVSGDQFTSKNNGIVNMVTGAIIIPPEYDNIWGDATHGPFRVEKDDRYGYFDMEGNVIVPVIFITLGYFDDGYAIFIEYIEGTKYGCIDKEGNVTIPAIYDYIRENYDGVAVITKDGKHGLISMNGNIITPPIYEEILINNIDTFGFQSYDYDFAPFYDDVYAWVRNDGKSWRIDKTGNEIFPKEEFKTTIPGWSWVETNGMWGLIDEAGAFIVQPEYDLVYLYSSGIVKVSKDEKWGIYSETGIELLPVEYDKITMASEDLAWITKDGKRGLLEIILPPYVNPYVDVNEDDWFFDDVCYVSEKGLIGGISEQSATDGAADDMFGPGNTVSREMLAAALYRLAGSPTSSSMSRDMLYNQLYDTDTASGAPFVDVEGDGYNYAAVVWAAEKEIMSARRQGIFGAGDDASRQELVVALARFAYYNEMELQQVREYADFSGFIDESLIPDDAMDDVKLLYEASVIFGNSDGGLDPQGSVTKAELAALIHRLLEAAIT